MTGLSYYDWECMLLVNVASRRIRLKMRPMAAGLLRGAAFEKAP